MKVLFEKGHMVDPSLGIDGPMALLVHDGTIVWVGDEASAQGIDALRIDCGGAVLAPGFVDLHVHFRDPGQTAKEDLASGCAAAAAGGFTAVVTMANTTPAIDSAELVRDIIERSRNLDCHVYPAAAVTLGLKGKELANLPLLAMAGSVAFTDDGYTIDDHAVALAAMEEAAKLKMPVSVHCEAGGLGGDRSMNRGDLSRELGLEGVPAIAEELMIARDIMLALETGCHLHVQHVSTALGVELIARAKARGITVSGEATPHHMALTDQAVRCCGTNAKMSPPLRTEADRLAVCQGLIDGVLDVVATDHAPHTPEEKSAHLSTAPNGIVGLETALPVTLTQLQSFRGFSLPLLVDRMSTVPCRLFNLPGGTFKPGSPADLVVFDPYGDVTVDASQFRSKSRNSPFDGQTFKGAVKLTVLGGRVTWRSSSDVAPELQ